ncbi:MAG: hypothetical protein DWQ34_20140 [Planctomycetota bacterium]|nr:MAG: hypothetical protein DWQ34_20140 [Planctomycetota bacterium]REK29313.1 MAG: hypothetical protein DWQ41_04300 [Planctomycetota bacterium]REK35952.1 MAG: hypothetical protein DWQ45_10560 [Planctomycetota bacterium]
MTRIFLTLTIIGNTALLGAFWLGWQIEDSRSMAAAAQQQVTWHFFVALGAALLALLVHAVALTYFMGTGRWLEETSEAYDLGPEPRRENIRLKYRALPGMILCILLLVATVALGAAADPASYIQFKSAVVIHFSLALATVVGNLLASWMEHTAIASNGRLVEEVLTRVSQIRRDRGLDPA